MMGTLVVKMKFFNTDLFSKCDQIQFFANVVIFTVEIINGKLVCATKLFTHSFKMFKITFFEELQCDVNPFMYNVEN